VVTVRESLLQQLLVLEYLSRIRFSPAQWRLARTSFPRRTHATILDMYSWARLVGWFATIASLSHSGVNCSETARDP